MSKRLALVAAWITAILVWVSIVGAIYVAFNPPSTPKQRPLTAGERDRVDALLVSGHWACVGESEDLYFDRDTMTVTQGDSLGKWTVKGGIVSVDGPNRDVEFTLVIREGKTFLMTDSGLNDETFFWVPHNE